MVRCATSAIRLSFQSTVSVWRYVGVPDFTCACACADTSRTRFPCLVRVILVCTAQCDDTGPYLTFTAAGKVAVALCSTAVVSVCILVLFQVFRGAVVSVSLKEFWALLTGMAMAVRACVGLGRKPAAVAKVGAGTGTGTGTNGSAAVGSGVDVEMSALGSTSAMRDGTQQGQDPVEEVTSASMASSSDGLKDASTYQLKSGWRTKVKIGFSFFQVSASGIESARCCYTVTARCEGRCMIRSQLPVWRRCPRQ
jgi:hypothetical protein